MGCVPLHPLPCYIEGRHIKRDGIEELLENSNIKQRKYVTG
jgi:hypothetical protein